MRARQVLLNCEAFKLCFWYLIICDVSQLQVEEFLKRVNKPEEEAPSQAASPPAEAGPSSSSSDSEAEEGVSDTQPVTLKDEDQKPLFSSEAVTEPGGSDVEGDAAASGSSGRGAGTERSCGRQLVSLDIPNYLREETEDVSQGISILFLQTGSEWAV